MSSQYVIQQAPFIVGTASLDCPGARALVIHGRYVAYVKSQMRKHEMNWQSVSKFLNIIAFLAGILLGVANAYPPTPLSEWPFIAIFMAIGILMFPFIINSVLEFHLSIRSPITLENPRLDRCFFSISRPLDILLFVAHLTFWQGLGVFLTFWICWPHNLIFGVSMMSMYYSITYAIQMALANAESESEENTQ